MQRGIYVSKNNAESLCKCCIHYVYVSEKTTPGTLRFPAHPYCNKEHKVPDFLCPDFETTRERIRNRIESLESQIELLEEKLASKDK